MSKQVKKSVSKPITVEDTTPVLPADPEPSVVEEITPEVKEEQVSQDILELRSTLEELGVQYDLTDGVVQLSTKLSAFARKANSDLTAKKVDKLTARLNSFGRETYLTDREFVKRLFSIGVPDFYLKTLRKNEKDINGFQTFMDKDASLTDAQLWRKVNACPYSPVNFKEFMLRQARFDKTKIRNG